VAPGDIFRQEIRAKSELGMLVEGIMARGELVDDATTLRVIEKSLSSNEARKGFVLDGYPRNLNQALALERTLGSRGEELDLVLNLAVREEDILQRARTRRVCAKCGKPYSLAVRPPKVQGKCDECGGELVVRKDDCEETVRERLSVYDRLTRPLEGYYREKGLMITVDGEGEVAEVARRIDRELRSRGLVQS
jgi:adenylate kinase